MCIKGKVLPPHYMEILSKEKPVLDYVSQVQNKLNYFGSQLSMLCKNFVIIIWKIQLDFKLSSPSCPVKFFQ